LGGALVGIVPSESVTELGLEYYVEVENSGVARTDPPGAPDSVRTQAVTRPTSVLSVPLSSGIGFPEGQALPIRVDLPPGAIFRSGALHYRIGGVTSYASIALDGEADPPAIPAADVGPRGIQYWVEVTTATTVVTDPAENPAELPKSVQITVSTLMEPEEAARLDFRMVSVPVAFPGGLGITLEDILADEADFGPFAERRWRAMRFDPEACGYVEFPGLGGDEFLLEPGKAFFLQSLSDNSLDTAPVPALSTPTAPFAVTLKPGWNQIGHPFAFPVSWAAVTKSTDVGEPLEWDPASGQYLQAQTLRPFAGYFVRSMAAQMETLWIPPTETTTPRAPSGLPGALLREIARGGCQDIGPAGWAEPGFVMDFGTVAHGDTAALDIVFRGVPRDTFVVQGAAFEHPAYSLPETTLAQLDAGIVLAPEDEFTTQIRFAPLESGPLDSRVVLTSSNSLSPRSTINLLGFGREIDISVTQVLVSDLGLSIWANVDGAATVDEVQLLHRPGGSVTYSTTGMSLDEDLDRYVATVALDSPTDALRGVDYRVAASNGMITVSTDPQHARMTVPSIPIPRAAEQYPGRYEMVSLPLEMQGTMLGTVADDLGGVDATRWRLFAYESAFPNYVEVPTDDFSEFERGRGYWLVMREPTALDTGPATGRSTRADIPFEILLQSGWNLIGNPFAFDVAWGDIDRSEPDSIDAPWAFDPSRGATGDYEDDAPATLTPFRGYLVRNRSSQPQTLRIHPREANNGDGARKEPSAPSWQLVLTAAAAEASGTVIVGSHAESLAGFDELDRERPPSPPGPWLSTAIVHRDWGPRAGLYRRDLRDMHADGHSWEIEIVTQERAEDVVLTGRWSPEPDDYLSLRLFDLEQGVFTELRHQAGKVADYRFVSFGPDRPYRLAVLGGSPDYVEREGAALVELPASLSLDRNAPNPFRRATRIRFGLPEPTTASLSVFNLEGRRVVRLVDRTVMSAGFHTAVWDGRDGYGRRVASGVYFYRLETNEAVLTKKMLVLR
jgi:hypothetical protein